MTPDTHHPEWTVITALMGIYTAYYIIEALRTGETKGRGGFTYHRDADPCTYWTGIVIGFVMCVAFTLMAVSNW